MSKLKQPYH